MQGVRLSRFLEDGTLGTIRLGLSREALESECGLPDDVSVSARPLLWKYGALQIAFGGDLVDFIGIYFCHGTFPFFGCNRAIEPVGWWPNSDTTDVAIQAHLEHSEIRWRPDPRLTFDEQRSWVVGIGVGALFEERGGRWTLNSLQLSSGFLE